MNRSHPAKRNPESGWISTWRFYDDNYWYFRRRKPKTTVYHRINGKTWAEVAEMLGLSIPNLFRFLELTSFYI